MTITIFSFLSALLWSSLLVVAIYLLRHTRFKQHFGVLSMVMLYLFCAVRLFLPIEFPYTLIAADSVIYPRIYSLLMQDFANRPLLILLCCLWLLGFCELLFRYVRQYRKAIYSITHYAEPWDERTTALLEQVQEMGVKVCYVTLHVGLGTFRPVKEEEITDHEMHSEYCMISAETAETINRTKREGGRVICVGTTSCRTIESWAAEDGTLKECAGWTNIFIYPGYRFKALDCLITNFHLPESTLIMLVSALAGREHVLAAYKEAVEQRYRFFSFGDAMFIG